MPIIAKGSSEGGDFQPCPSGVYQAVCVDVIDMGLLEVTYSGTTKSQHKIRICWQVDEPMENGKPFLVQKRYTLSLNEKATLRHDLESWRGRSFTDDEMTGFDVEKLLGVNAMVNVTHAVKGDRTYANVVAVMPLPKNMAKIAARDYVRHIDRTPDQQNNHGPVDAPDVDDIPF